MMKVRQKISGTFRSLDALDAFRRLFLGNPFLPTPNSQRLLNLPPTYSKLCCRPLAPT